jgi:hypothetical protein
MVYRIIAIPKIHILITLKKKKPFTLLEVILAIALVSLAGPILFTIPFRLAKHEIIALYDIELERIADQEWNLIKLQLLQQEVPWKSLADAEMRPFPLEKKTCRIAFSKRYQRTFKIERTIVKSQKKMLSGDREARLIKVTLSFLPENRGEKVSFDYQIAIQKATKSESANSL